MVEVSDAEYALIESALAWAEDIPMTAMRVQGLSEHLRYTAHAARVARAARLDPKSKGAKVLYGQGMIPVGVVFPVEWQPIETAPEGVLVEVKVDRGNGVRNRGKLKRFRQLWFTDDLSGYANWEPTHWRPVQS